MGSGNVQTRRLSLNSLILSNDLAVINIYMINTDSDGEFETILRSSSSSARGSNYLYCSDGVVVHSGDDPHDDDHDHDHNGILSGLDAPLLGYDGDSEDGCSVDGSDQLAIYDDDDDDDERCTPLPSYDDRVYGDDEDMIELLVSLESSEDGLDRDRDCDRDDAGARVTTRRLERSTALSPLKTRTVYDDDYEAARINDACVDSDTDPEMILDVDHHHYAAEYSDDLSVAIITDHTDDHGGILDSDPDSPPTSLQTSVSYNVFPSLTLDQLLRPISGFARVASSTSDGGGIKSVYNSNFDNLICSTPRDVVLCSVAWFLCVELVSLTKLGLLT
jgi:hypothetical protein